MEFKAWIALNVIGIGLLGCGKPTSDQITPIVDRPDIPQTQSIKVEGSAAFGGYCPFGTYTAPQAVPLSLWECPMSLDTVQLVEPLQAFDFQADCKKRTLDVRSPNHAFEPVTWEMMPDGNFYFSMDGGVAKLKTDGVGNTNCTTPLRADMWGKVDCQDRDKPVIHIETIWWLGRKFDHSTEPVGTPSAAPTGTSPNPTATHSPSPSATPHPPVSPVPSPVPRPSYSPMPTPQPTTRPSPRPSPRLEGFLQPHRENLPASGGGGAGSCKLPAPRSSDAPGCYFHNLSRVNQCS